MGGAPPHPGRDALGRPAGTGRSGRSVGPVGRAGPDRRLPAVAPMPRSSGRRGAPARPSPRAGPAGAAGRARGASRRPDDRGPGPPRTRMRAWMSRNRARGVRRFP
ncbi:hypothetical protein EAO69_33970 [Streptomyces sp. me109]|nr:hypothetical protein EAO69_33970 [Streptomyces sp. me109]